MRDFIVRWLWVAAVGVGAVAIFYIAFTVHQHNGELTCMKTAFDQVLNELAHHAHLKAPPNC